MRGSGGVSCIVSLPTGADGPRRRVASRGPGLNLVRCGTSYLFQIRLPIALGGGRAAPPIRIGIGARPAHDARRIAGILATLARAEFARIEARRMSDDETKSPVPEIKPMVSGDDPKEVMIEMRGYMKVMYQRIKGELPEPHRSTTSIRILVSRRAQDGRSGWRETVCICQRTIRHVCASAPSDVQAAAIEAKLEAATVDRPDRRFQFSHLPSAPRGLYVLSSSSLKLLE